jgi:H+/Cl- antiporter ClcA
MTVGDGNLVSSALLKQQLVAEYYGKSGFDKQLLIQSGFAKMLCLGVSLNCGMIGGFVFPMLTIGIIASIVAHQHQPDIPILLFISCFMTGIPSGICPSPVTMMR